MESSPSDAGVLTTAEEEVQQSGGYEEPQGELEQTIAHLWKETFHLERVGRNSNFFELGGNSLIGIELMDKVSTSFDVQLPVVLLFQNPTPLQMAQCIDTLKKQELTP